ncbi:hypothetical protein TWF173_000856, partial [Orbilia oligospora]
GATPAETSPRDVPETSSSGGGAAESVIPDLNSGKMDAEPSPPENRAVIVSSSDVSQDEAALITTSDHNSQTELLELNFVVNQTINAIVCHECKVCVGVDRLISHLKNNIHKRNDSYSKAMKTIEGVVKPLNLMTHDDIIKKERELRDGTPGPPLADINPPIRAYKCKSCNVIRIDTSTWHYQRGCTDKTTLECQAQLLHTGKGKIYFEVLQARPATPTPESELLSRELEVLEESCAITDNGPNEDTMATPPWLQRTQWLHYGGNGLEVAAKFAELTDIPTDLCTEYHILQPIVRATDDLLRSSLGLLPDVDVVTLKELRSPGETTSPRLFCAKQVADTHTEYFKILIRLVCFLVRLQWLKEDDLVAIGVDLDQRTATMIKDLITCADDPALHQQLPDRIIALLIKNILVQPYGLKRFSNLGINFLCLLGYDRESKIFRPPERYTRFLAGFVFAFRLLTLRACFRYRDKMMARDSCNGDAAFQLYFKSLNGFLKDNSRTVFGEALSLLAYGKALSFDSLSLNKIHWDDTSGYTKLSYKGHIFDIKLFKTFVSEEINILDNLTGELLFCLDKTLWPKLPQNIYDVQSETTLGWSYAQDGRNDFKSFSSHLLRRIYQAPELKVRFFTSDGVLKYSAAQDYLDLVDRYLVVLAMVMHMTGGQPPRGPEILSSLVCNTAKYQRNFFIWEGRTVVSAISYNKTMAFTGSAKVFLRFDLMVKPFASYLRRKIGCVVKSPFLFRDSNGNQWKTERLSAALADGATASFGFNLKISTYRQLAVAMTKKHLERFGVMVQRLKETAIEESSFTFQSGHSQVTRESYYGVDAESMGPGAVVENSRIASMYWHFFIGAVSDLPDWIFQPPVLQHEMINVLKRKWSALYGESESSLPLSMVPILNPTPPTINPQLEIPQITPQTTTSTPTAPAAGLLQHLSSYTTPNPYPKQVIQALVAMHGPEAKFKCDTQAEFARSLFLRHGPLLAILPTSIGKTEAILIAMKIPGAKFTVIIEPYLATCEDVINRAEEKNIEVTFYRGPQETPLSRLRAPKFPHLIVSTPESAITSSFRALLGEFWARRQLDRIVIDECHQPILDEGFRKLDKLVHLSAIPVQLVFMTASLPPIMSGAFSDFTGIQSYITLRTPTNVKNVSYSVVVDAGFLIRTENLLHQEIENIQKQNGKIVIFCRSKAQVMHFTSLKSIPVLPFYSGMTPDQRSIILESFETLEEYTVLAATTCWSAGYNAKNVLLGIFCGLPYSSADFVQQAGRVARQGQKGRVVIFCSKPTTKERNHLSRQPWRNVLYQGLLDFVQTKECRRLVLSQLNDGQPVECRTCGAELCDNCKGALVGEHDEGGSPEPSVQDVRRSIAQKKQQQQEILAALMQLGRGHCAACYLIGSKIIHTDGCHLCPFGEPFEKFSQYFGKVPNYCYTCSLPLKLTGCAADEGISCCNHNGPRAFCWAVWQDDDLKERIFGYMNLWQADLNIGDLQGYASWLTNTVNDSGEGDNNMWKLLCALQAIDLLPLL